MNDSRIRLICFDLGGVLIRICRSWTEGCAAAKLDLRQPHQLLEARNGYYVPHELVDLYQTGRITCDEYFRKVSAAIDHRYSPAEIAAVHDAWILGEYEGVTKLIARIHQAGLRTAALSNTNHSHWIRMDEFPAVMSLTHRFASHEIGLAKPDPAIFQEFERRVGVVGGEILYFDDLAENIVAAQALGWDAVLIDPMSRTDAQMARALAQRGF